MNSWLVILEVDEEALAPYAIPREGLLRTILWRLSSRRECIAPADVLQQHAEVAAIGDFSKPKFAQRWAYDPLNERFGRRLSHKPRPLCRSHNRLRHTSAGAPRTASCGASGARRDRIVGASHGDFVPGSQFLLRCDPLCDSLDEKRRRKPPSRSRASVKPTRRRPMRSEFTIGPLDSCLDMSGLRAWPAGPPLDEHSTTRQTKGPTT